MSSDSISLPAARPARLRASARRRARALAGLGDRLVARPELVGLLALTGTLNLWGLSVNGWANTYYAAAVRSMSGSWHDFLFASLDKAGLMTVDKPPLALWVQALSARVFGFHPLSILVPQALMGVVAVGLVYDLTRRRFGRPSAVVAGFVLATTPIFVAVSRHNNPDELLILCSVAAVWFTLRGLEDGRTRWLVLSGVCVGLGFETKMGLALLVVPGIAAGWMWIAPGGRIAAMRQLLAGGAAMAIVGGAWPLLVTLTPAADRPWISGTSDNSVWSLIFGYNGLGRVAGQSGGPGGGPAGFGGALFGGATGPFRLLQSGLGEQAGWLLGLAVVVALAILLRSRLARRDSRTGWLIVVGGALATSAVVFSFARGIFHPYYVSFLTPFAAALVGAGVSLMLPRTRGAGRDARAARLIAPLAIAGGAISELVVLGGLNGQLPWAVPLVVVVAGAGVVALSLELAPRLRAALVAAAMAALLAAPATWAAGTLGHPTSGTFPAGGPASTSIGSSGGQGGPGGATGRFAPPGSGGGSPAGGPPGAGGTPGAGGLGGNPFGGDTADLTAAVRYAKAHGGGAIGVSSQSSAAAVILSSGANVAGLGGFSGRESSVTASWLAMEVRSGRLRWVLGGEGQRLRLPNDTRTGSQAVMSIVQKTCTSARIGTSVTMYDCRGRASLISRGPGR